MATLRRPWNDQWSEPEDVEPDQVPGSAPIDNPGLAPFGQGQSPPPPPPEPPDLSKSPWWQPDTDRIDQWEVPGQGSPESDKRDWTTPGAPTGPDPGIPPPDVPTREERRGGQRRPPPPRLPRQDIPTPRQRRWYEEPEVPAPPPAPLPPAAAPPPAGGGFDRTRFRDEWMARGASYGGDVERFVRDNPEFATGVTAIPRAGGLPDVWRLPTGEVLDLVIDIGGRNQAGWTGTEGGGGGGEGGGGGGGAQMRQPSVPSPGLPSSARLRSPGPAVAAAAGDSGGGAGGAGGGINVGEGGTGVTGGFQEFIKRLSVPSDLNKVYNASLQKRIERGDALTPMSAQQFEAIRQPIERGRRTQTNQAMAELASRGLLSAPGAEQGAERTALERIEQSIAPEWATGLQNAAVENARQDREMFQNALGLAGRAQETERDVLMRAMAAAGQQELGHLGEQRLHEQMIADIALGNLDQNRQWNTFLMQFGLDSERVKAEIAQGNQAQLTPLLRLYFDMEQARAKKTTTTDRRYQ